MLDPIRPAFRRLVVLVLIGSLLTPAGVGAVAASSDESAVSYVRTVEEIDGHLQLSVAQFEDGNRAAASEHTTEIVDELGPVVLTEVATANESLATELESAFQAAHDTARNGTAEEYATVVETEVRPLLDRAETAVVAEDRLTNTTFNAKVVAGLLERASAEYTEGITDSGEVHEEMDYWAAQAYAERAAVRYEAQIKSDVSEHAAEELDEMFESLEGSMASAAAPEDVTSMTSSITHELAEYTGLSVEASGDGVAAIERIEGDLHEAVEAYESGNVAEAKSIVKQTYLSNFEGVEGTLIENDPDLVEELEADFNEKLPGLMDDGAPVSDVRAHVEEMEGKLHEAEEILASEDETDIDLGTGDEQTTTANGTETDGDSGDGTDGMDDQTTDGTGDQTGIATPGFGVLAVLVALGLLAGRRYRRH